jgi:hypothetical protein
MPTLSQAVLLGLIGFSDAIELRKTEPIKPEPNADSYNYGQFGKSMPTFWDDFVGRDPFFSNTWRHTEYEGHIVQVANSTAYVDDTNADYHFPTGLDQWEETTGSNVPGGADTSAYL